MYCTSIRQLNYILSLLPGAVCSRSSTEGGSFGEEAVQQRTPPAVDVLGGDPQAAQNVAGSSLQPVVAAPLPPLDNMATSQPERHGHVGENNTPTETHPNDNTKDSLEEGTMSDSGGEAVQGRLGPSHPKDPSLSTESHSDRLYDTPTDGTAQYLHYVSQTDNSSHTDRQTSGTEWSAAGPGQDQALQQEVAGGLVVISGTERGQPLPETEKLEYKQETGIEELGGEHPARNLPSESCSTVSPLPLSPNKDTVPDHTEDRGMDQPQTTLPTQADQASHIPLSEVKEQAGILPNSEQPIPPVPITDNSKKKQTYISTEPKITQNSNDDQEEIQGANAVDQGPQESERSTEPSESRHVTLGSSQTLLPDPPTDVSGTPQSRETYSGLVPYTPPGSGNSTPDYTTDRQESESDIQKNPPHPAEKRIETNRAEEETETAKPSPNFTIQSQSSFLQETTTAATSPIHHLPSTEIDLMQTEQSEVLMSNPDHKTRMETLLVSELVLSTDARGAVMLGGETSLELSEEVQVDQCVLLEEHLVSGDTAVIELNSEPSDREPTSFIEGTHSDIEMAPLAAGEFEIYSFVEEEIAIEVVGERPSLSPNYEVNLFTPLIEHSENCTASEGQEIHLLSYPQASNDNDQVIIQQGPLSSDHGLSEMVCSNDFTPSLSTQDVEMTDEGQNFEPENTTTEMDNAVVEDSSEVCVVQTVPVSDTPDGQMDTCAQATAPCLETSTAVSDHRGVSISPATSLSDTQTLPEETEVGATASTSSLVSPMEELTEVVVQSTSQHSIEVLSSPITIHLPEGREQNCPPLKEVPGVTLQNTTEPKPCVSSHEGTKYPQPCPTLTETPVQTQQDVYRTVNVTTTEANPEASRSTHSSGIIDPKLLLLKRGDTPLLKHPPSLLLGVSRQQSNSLTQASASSSSCGSDTAPVLECLPKAVSAAVSVPLPKPLPVSSHRDQTEPSVKREPTAAPPATPATNTPSQSRLPPPSTPTPTPCKSDKEALTPIKTSTGKAVTVSQTLNPNITNASSKPLSALKLPSTSGNVTRSKLSGSPSDGSQSGPPPVIRPRLAGVKGPGLSSPKEESSDEEADLAVEAQPGRRSMVNPSPAESKVRQWIADRVTQSSSPTSSSISSPSPGLSSPSDWTPSTTPLILRGAQGRFLSLPSMGPGGSSPSDPVTPHRPRMERHADMAELAKHEAEIEGRTVALKREGFWSVKRLTRLTEPVRPKVHWDYLCEEMQWLSGDFAQERRWKRGVARKVVRMVMRHHEELRQKEEKAKRDEHAKIRRVASNIAKEVRAFWSSVEKVVQYKQQSRLEEKRKKALDLQLDFIVGQTEKYSDLLSQALETAPAGNSEPTPSPPKTSLPLVVDEDDRDFEPPCGEEEEDDEETIEVEEEQDGNDPETQRREIELLRQEGTMSLAELLSTLKRPLSQDSEEECSDNSSTTVDVDAEFTANEENAEDEEDTIAAQEVVEGEADHAGELDDLAKEGDMTVEELLEKYKGAYASDFEEPSAPASPASSEESENSGDEEEESEEDESDVESNITSSDNEDSEEEEVRDNDEEDSDEDDECDEGMEILLKEGDHSPPLPTGPRPKKEISHIAATAESLQPKGYTLATTKLREYQHIGLDWLVTMYEKKLNGILADEMGLGKTIQTIALLAHLACEKGNWGPHLIIVPTSVMLNWEMELKRWCPGFKILTYYGSQKERKLKRQGWTKPNAFHVCITSYKLVLQDHQAFRRKSWRYLILDEAQNIKNFKSQRWQSLLNFNSQRRLLLTGTPLQNSLMELWSLMHFLMPHVFQSHREFKEWFSNPLTGMIEGSQEYNEGLVKRLHKVLRPFLLRRIKVDVEKQMPKKYEHVVRCRLSKRQRFLYDDFMAQASTRETLASGHFMSVINILMQLRKVCNHPNLFDPRPIHSPFITKPIVFHTASLVQRALEISPFKRGDLSMFDLVGLEGSVSRYQADVFLPRRKVSRQLIQEVMESPDPPPRPKPVRMKVNRMFQPLPKADGCTVLVVNNPLLTCPVTPAAQAPMPRLIQDVTPTPTPPPPVQQVLCSVAPTAPSRLPMHPSGPFAVGTVVRSGSPMPVLAVRSPTVSCNPATHPTLPPSNVMTQRVLLSPDMQARLPSGEVVSIAHLASLAGRPVSSCQGSKPVTFQLQGNKLTLSGTQLHQVPVAPPRPVQGNFMHLVTSGGQHHLISQPAQVAVFSSATPSPAPSEIQLPLNASQVPSSMVTSSGIVKIVVRQSSKEGGGVPTLAVPPSPRVATQASPSIHHHANANIAVRTPPAHRHPGPSTAQYTLAPPRTPTSVTIRTATQAPPRIPTPAPPRTPTTAPPQILTPAPPRTPTPAPPQIPTPDPSQPQPPHPVLKIETKVETSTEQKARLNSLSTREESSDTKSAVPKSGSHVGGFVPPRPRAQPRPHPRSPFYMRDSRLTQIIRINDLHCSAKPMYGHEVLDFLTFLPGSCPAPAPRALGQWGRSGHAACLFAQFTFVIPPVEAPTITMHSCHPPPSLSHKQAVFTSLLSSQVAPLSHSKLQTLHTLLRRLKEGQHRVLIFTQMTRMLDVLEQFLGYHGHIYLRLDGSTRVEQRQSLMDRFNADRRIFCFILSTRSGGVGVNLTGADTVVFYDSDWNPTMDAQAQDRCHRIGQTRDVHIYRLISERTVEENILKKANQKRMLGDMAIEGGNFTTAFFKQQTIRELFEVTEGEKKEVTVELSVPQPEEEETGNKQSTTILEQALCRAEDEEDIVAASQAKAEQVAELAEFNEAIPLDEAGEGRDPEEEELSKAEQEIAALVEQLTPIERYAMNFLEASLEDVCKEELKQAEEQVEAARKGLDQAKEEGLKLQAGSSDNDEEDFSSQPAEESSTPGSGRRPRKHKEKGAPSTRTSGRLRGTTASPPPTSPDSDTPTNREVPERLRSALRGRGGTKDTTTPARTEHPRAHTTPARLEESAKPAATTPASPSRDSSLKSVSAAPPLRTQSHSSSVPSTATSPPAEKPLTLPGELDTKSPRREQGVCVSSCPVDHQSYSAQARDYDSKSLSPPSVCSLSRSPRKRQSADGEVLLGLPEHSPSAKVLRRLPGRLVTVVEDKEPRKRRRGSGTGGGSSEETEHAESGRGSDEPSRDATPQTPDKINQTPKEKGTASKYSSKTTNLPEDQESPSRHTHPARSYPPYSPPYHSPDMPVLRNLPVRRRLESESRVAAQLGEQGLGRGRGGNYHRKMDTQPGKEGNASSGTNVSNSTTPLKRKRGRPPKTPLRVAEPQPEHVSPPHPTSPIEEGSPPLSPKRKRGRPRKDSTTVTDAVGAVQNSNAPTASTTSQAGSLSDTAAVDTEPLPLSAPTKPQTVASSAVCTSQASPSTKAEDSTATLKADTKTEVPITTLTAILAPSPAQVLTTTAIPAPSRTQVPTSIPISVSTSSDVPVSSSPTISTSVPIAIPSTSSPTVPTLNSTSVPAASSPTVSTPSSHTVSTSRMTFGPASRSTSGPIRIPTAVLTSTLAQFLTSRPRVATSPPVSTSPSISTTTTTQIFTPTHNKISTLPLAQITIPTPARAQIPKMSTSASTPTSTPTPTVTNVKPTPTPVPTTIVTTHLPTLSKPTSIADLTTISTPAPPRIVTTVAPAPTTAITASPATTSIPTSTKITTTTPTPGPTPTITSTATPDPTTTVTTVKPTHTPVPTTINTTSAPIPNTIPTAAPTRTVTTVAAATTTTPTSTPSQVPNSTTTKIHTQISPPIPTPSSTQVLPLAQIPITSSISTAVAATENQALEPAPVETAHNRDSEKITDMEVDTQEAKEDKKTKEISDSQLKNRKVENSHEAKDTVSPTPSLADPEAPVAPRPEETDKQKVEESVGDDRAASKKRPLSRQSSQESVRSSSPSSVCSTSTPTRSAQHKKGAEKRAHAKRMRGEVCSDPEKGEVKTEEDFTNTTQRKQSRSSSSDSDTSETRKERLLTRSAQSRQETEGDGESNGRIGRPARSSERVGRTVSNNTSTGESGSQTSSVRVTRKSSVPQPTPEREPQPNSVPSSPTHPEVLGKRCSALNAAAKLLAMRGRIDTPGSRKDPAAKTSGQNATSPASSDKNQKSKSKSAPATPQTNCINKVGSSKTTTPTQSSHTAARSTRQCPGALVPALETNNKRGSKKKEKEKKKPSEGKEEGERETRSSRGHSACSSTSSDGGGSSQSSSNSLSSQSTGPRRNLSRAPSSGSERERSTERGRRRSHRKEGEGRGRETRKERKERHAQKRERLSQEGNAGSGEGTPDRVLRSVAAMAAAQARTPAANTRSSSAQHNKT
ncbi:unnamed protein product [Coregonus sp. 'balchen']|nr:unnamed protein product [Coregonus sp. 'balchen']